MPNPPRLLLALSALLLLGACASRSAAPLPGSPSTAGLPPFPVQRHTLTPTGYTRDGTDTYARSTGATDDGGGSLLLHAPGTQWAVYRFQPPTTPRMLDIKLQADKTDEAWIAFADYTSGRWAVVEGTYSTSLSLPINAARFVSPAGGVYVAVLVVDGKSADINSVTLTADNALPTAAIVPDQQSGQAPLIVQFQAGASFDPDGSIVKYEWDFDNDGVFEVNTDAVDHATFIFNNAGTFPVSVRVTDDGGDTATATTQVNVSPNQAPTASFTATPASGSSPLSVTVDATASSDPDGTVVKYEWDFDDDGSFEEDDGATPQAQHVFSTSGYHRITLRVTDNGGSSATAQQTIGVSSWTLQPVISLGAGQHAIPKLLNVDGNPAITYRGQATGLSYMRSFDTQGTAWIVPPVTLDATAIGVFDFASVNGKPAAVWSSNTNLIRYSRGSDVDGAGWTSATSVYPFSVNSGTFSLAEVDGVPAVAFEGLTTSFGLYYVRAGDADGATWGALQTLQTGQWRAPQLTVVAGNPAVAYCDLSNPGPLYYMRSTDNDGSNWGTAATPLGAENISGAEAFGLVSGEPAVAYEPVPAQPQVFQLGLDVDGAQWAQPVTFDSQTGAGSRSIAVINGKPAIAYCGSDVRYAAALDADGATWGPPLVVASGTNAPQAVTLAEIDGRPAVAYGFGQTDTVEFAILSP